MIEELAIKRFDERREFEKGTVVARRQAPGARNGTRHVDASSWRLGTGHFLSRHAVPPGHDSWVVGDEPYVSLHFLGADTYASE